MVFGTHLADEPLLNVLVANNARSWGHLVQEGVRNSGLGADDSSRLDTLTNYGFILTGATQVTLDFRWTGERTCEAYQRDGKGSWGR